MAEITITINTDNDAFSYHPGMKVQRIPDDLAERIRYVSSFHPIEIPLHDINGNRVGELIVKNEEVNHDILDGTTK